MSESVAVPSVPRSRRAARVAGPRWLDPRLILGVLLVLVSVVVGARLFAAQDEDVPVLRVTRDLRAGAVLSSSDLTLASVRLGSGGPSYLDAAGASPVGLVLLRDIGAGELLPRAAVVPASEAPPSRLVTVPVSSLHAPDVDALPQRQVDVLATYDKEGAAARTEVLLRNVTVDAVLGSGSLGSGGADRGVVLRVAPEQVTPLVTAIQTAALDLVLVVGGATDAATVATGPAEAAPPASAAPAAGASSAPTAPAGSVGGAVADALPVSPPGAPASPAAASPAPANPAPAAAAAAPAASPAGSS